MTPEQEKKNRLHEVQSALTPAFIVMAALYLGFIAGNLARIASALEKIAAK
jgi:hypothetical protein